MKEISVRICLLKDLPENFQELLFVANAVRLNAQAPYSKYLVGSAVRSKKTGLVYTGCNVERATWTQTTHAEQNAIDSMVATEGPSAIEALALIGRPKGVPVSFLSEADAWTKPIEQAVSPCGHCLQIIWENCRGDNDVPVLGLLSNGEVSLATIGDLFPIKFGPCDLGIDYEDITTT